MNETLMGDDQDDTPEVDPNKNYLEELVGENKKFKSPEDLAKGKYLADIHVRTLEQRLDELREDYNKLDSEYKTGQKLQELLDKMESVKLASSREETHSNEERKPAYETPEDLESLVSNKILQHKQIEKETENFKMVQAKLNERYGNAYKSVLKEQSQQLGLSDSDVDVMARKNPNLFFKTFDLDVQPVRDNFQAPPQSNVRQSSFAPKTQKRTYAYYQEMRKTNPSLYYDPKIAVQMDKDAQALGKDFFDV